MKLRDIIGKDIVVNCKSLEEYNRLKEEYEKICKDGIVIKYPQVFDSITCYRLTTFSMCYDKISYYKERKYKIIQLSDLEEFVTQCENYEIHITNKQNKTYGVMKSNGVIIKKVETTKHPLDDFSFEVASDVIMDRLFDRQIKATNPLEIKEVKRRAKVGEWVKVINAGIVPKTNEVPDYRNGSILQVVAIDDNYKDAVFYGTDTADYDMEKIICRNEYIVLENYMPSHIKKLSDYTNEELLSEIKKRMA